MKAALLDKSRRLLCLLFKRSMTMSKYDEIDFEKIALHMQKQVETDPNNVQLRNELAIRMR